MLLYYIVITPQRWDDMFIQPFVKSSSLDWASYFQYSYSSLNDPSQLRLLSSLPMYDHSPHLPLLDSVSIRPSIRISWFR